MLTLYMVGLCAMIWYIPNLDLNIFLTNHHLKPNIVTSTGIVRAKSHRINLQFPKFKLNTSNMHPVLSSSGLTSGNLPKTVKSSGLPK